MKQIEKYYIGYGYTKMPVGAKILHYCVTNGFLHAYALVDKSRAEVDTIRALSTGDALNAGHYEKYVDSFAVNNNGTILHIFKL